MTDKQPLISDPTGSPETPTSRSLNFNTSSHTFGFDTHLDVSPPSSPPSRFQLGRAGLQTGISETRPSIPATLINEDERDIANNGLRILKSQSQSQSALRRNASIPTLSTVPVELKSPTQYSTTTLSPLGTGDPFLGGFPKDSTSSTPDLRQDRTDYEQFRRGVPQNAYNSEALRSLRDHQQFNRAPSFRSAYNCGRSLYNTHIFPILTPS